MIKIISFQGCKDVSPYAGCKINIEKSVPFLYTNNNWLERNQEENIIYNNLKKLNI
jgi:hypothetical protein